MKLRYGDFIIFGVVALLAAGALLAGLGSKLPAAGAAAEVWQDGKLVRTVNLNEISSPIEFELIGQYHDKIIAEKGRIRFEQADCPDKTCVHTGWISRPGQVAACVPNRVLIKIVGADSEQDVVVR
jgi:hypothetical protein